MKSVVMHLSCLLIALGLFVPTITVMKSAKNDIPTNAVGNSEETRQIIYAPQPIETEIETKEEPAYEDNTYRQVIYVTEYVIETEVEVEETEEEYFAAPEIEFQPFSTYVYNGTRKKLPASKHLQRIVCETAERYDLPYRIVLALLGAETTWNENADHVETHNGARYIGIGCVNEKYHAADMAKRGIDVYTLNGNVEAICWLLKVQYERFGTIELALMAYNGGAGYVQWALERGIMENGYTRTVTGYAESFE